MQPGGLSFDLEMKNMQFGVCGADIKLVGMFYLLNMTNYPRLFHSKLFYNSDLKCKSYIAYLKFKFLKRLPVTQLSCVNPNTPFHSVLSRNANLFISIKSYMEKCIF